MAKWSAKHDKCCNCGTREQPHFAGGRCKRCFTQGWIRWDKPLWKILGWRR